MGFTSGHHDFRGWVGGGRGRVGSRGRGYPVDDIWRGRGMCAAQFQEGNSGLTDCHCLLGPVCHWGAGVGGGTMDWVGPLVRKGGRREIRHNKQIK